MALAGRAGHLSVRLKQHSTSAGGRLERKVWDLLEDENSITTKLEEARLQLRPCLAWPEWWLNGCRSMSGSSFTLSHRTLHFSSGKSSSTECGTLSKMIFAPCSATNLNSITTKHKERNKFTFSKGCCSQEPARADLEQRLYTPHCDMCLKIGRRHLCQFRNPTPREIVRIGATSACPYSILALCLLTLFIEASRIEVRCGIFLTASKNQRRAIRQITKRSNTFVNRPGLP